MLSTTSLLPQTGPQTTNNPRPLSADLPQAKVLILGESGAGKTTLLSALIGQPVTQPPWTVGATVDYVLHFYRAGTTQERPYFIELWDVGGSRAHRNARRIFYRNVVGCILVHDLANSKTEHNLRGWLGELFGQHAPGSQAAGVVSPYSPFGGYPTPHCGRVSNTCPSANIAIGMSPPGGDEENGCGCHAPRDIPVLVVGTKLDQYSGAAARASGPTGGQMSKVAQELICTFTHNHNQIPQKYPESEELWLNALTPLPAGSTNALKLDRFYDKIIERLETKKLSASGSGGTPIVPMGITDARRRRLAFP